MAMRGRKAHQQWQGTSGSDTLPGGAQKQHKIESGRKEKLHYKKNFVSAKRRGVQPF